MINPELEQIDDPKKRMLAALEMHLGIVSMAAKEARVGRSTHYLWMKEDEEYRKQVEEMQELALDTVENHLMLNIKDGDTTAAIFYLKTKGKKRGYIERTEIDTSGSLHLTWNEQKTYVQPNDTYSQTNSGT